MERKDGKWAKIPLAGTTIAFVYPRREHIDIEGESGWANKRISCLMFLTVTQEEG